MCAKKLCYKQKIKCALVNTANLPKQKAKTFAEVSLITGALKSVTTLFGKYICCCLMTCALP